MKKMLALILTLLLLGSLFAGCKKNSASDAADSGELALTDPALAPAAPTADNARVL